MSSDTDWNSNVSGGFGQHNAETDEYYHRTGAVGDSMTETWFWNFHVPEAAINCYIYCWAHPNLDVVSAGLFIYKGRKSQHLECELFDFYNFMSASVIGDGSHIRLPNGLSIDVIKPLEHIELHFDDPSRDTCFKVTLRDVAPPIMRANNQHFEQLMHASGSLRLRGDDYTVDCLPVRDRSWGELRPEAGVSAPPYTWVTGSFGKDFAFNVGAHDDPALSPEWLGVVPVPDRLFKDGWVLVKGEQRRIVAASKITRREFPLCSPVDHQYEFTDSSGETYRITGRVIAQTKWSGWSNMICHLGLVEWSWEGRTGYGETQEVHWNDYVWKINQPPK